MRMPFSGRAEGGSGLCSPSLGWSFPRADMDPLLKLGFFFTDRTSFFLAFFSRFFLGSAGACCTNTSSALTSPAFKPSVCWSSSLISAKSAGGCEAEIGSGSGDSARGKISEGSVCGLRGLGKSGSGVSVGWSRQQKRKARSSCFIFRCCENSLLKQDLPRLDRKETSLSTQPS